MQHHGVCSSSLHQDPSRLDLVEAARGVEASNVEATQEPRRQGFGSQQTSFGDGTEPAPKKRTGLRQLAHSAEKGLIDFTDVKLRRFRHGLWMALLILGCTIIFTVAMTTYYLNQCSRLALLASALDLADDDTESNRVPIQLLQLSQTSGVSIVTTRAIVNFNPEDVAEAAVANVSSSLAWGFDKSSNGGFERTYNDGNPLPVYISYSLPVLCVQPGINYEGNSMDVTGMEICEESTNSASSSSSKFQLLYDLTNGCYLNTCSITSVVNIISVTYDQCTPFEQAFSLATAYVAYVDMTVTSLIILLYLIATGECRNNKKGAVRTFKEFFLQSDVPDPAEDEKGVEGREEGNGSRASAPAASEGVRRFLEVDEISPSGSQESHYRNEAGATSAVV